MITVLTLLFLSLSPFSSSINNAQSIGCSCNNIKKIDSGGPLYFNTVTIENGQAIHSSFMIGIYSGHSSINSSQWFFKSSVLFVNIIKQILILYA